MRDESGMLVLCICEGQQTSRHSIDPVTGVSHTHTQSPPPAAVAACDHDCHTEEAVRPGLRPPQHQSRVGIMATLPPGYKPREGLMPSVNKPNLRPSFGGKPPVGPGVLGTLHDDLNQWWANWGARVTGLVVVVLYSLALVWVGFSAGTAVADGCNVSLGPASHPPRATWRSRDHS